MRWSIRYQLLLPLFLLLLGVLGISTWTGVSSAHRARHQIETDVRNVAHTLSALGSRPNKNILGLMKHISGADFVVLDVRELVPSDSDGPPTTLPVMPSNLPRAEVVVDDWQTLRLGPRIDVGGQAYLGSGVQLRSGSTLYILYPEQFLSSALWEAVRPSLVIGIGGGIASLMLALAVSGRLGRRISELGRRTSLIAAGDFSPMPLPRRNDELRDLGQSVNNMAEQLAKMTETLKQTERLRLLGQIGGGLAHQLRNGVTGARLSIQLHARTCEADAESLDVALRQLSLVEANLKRFLDLGNNGADLRCESCDLAELLGEVVALLHPQCQHAHTELRWQAPAKQAVIQGDSIQLGQLFLNVITNAIEAAGPNGWVEIQMKKAEGGPWNVEIHDSGSGPSAELSARLFQPFVTGKREGVGLGLAVARQVAEAHGGRVDWRRENSQTCFRIELPGGKS